MSKHLGSQNPSFVIINFTIFVTVNVLSIDLSNLKENFLSLGLCTKVISSSMNSLYLFQYERRRPKSKHFHMQFPVGKFNSVTHTTSVDFLKTLSIKVNKVKIKHFP